MTTLHSTTYAVLVVGTYLYESDSPDETERLWRSHQEKCIHCKDYPTTIFRVDVTETITPMKDLPVEK